MNKYDLAWILAKHQQAVDGRDEVIRNITAKLSAAEARLFSMRLPFHPEAKRDA